MTTKAKPRKEPIAADEEEIRELVALLRSDDGFERQDARRTLERIGEEALPFLIDALEDRNARVRWEAAKALGRIRDPSSGPALVRSLRDRMPEVRWLAAEGLIALQEAAVLPILHALVQDGDSPALRHGAHHVFHALERIHRLPREGIEVLESLRSIEPGVTVPMSARSAIAALGAAGRRDHRFAASDDEPEEGQPS